MSTVQINKKGSQNSPISLLIHGSNEISITIAKSLIEQGGSVIVVDQFNSKSKKYITQLKELGRADFVDFKGLNDLIEKLPRIDYIFYFLHDYLVDTKEFSSKEFLDETTYLNTVLASSKKFNSKFSLVSTIKLNQDLSAHILNNNLSAPSPYSPIELQKYCETLCAESRDKLKINARIIRLGSVLGNGSEVIADQTVLRLLNECLYKTELTIYGEGLDIHYILNSTDAVYGILKLTFSEKTEGEVISLANNHDYSTLSLAYKLLELNPDLSQIKFQPTKEIGTIIFDQYVPAKNAVEYGWLQKVSIEQTLAETLSTFHPEKGKKILDAPRKAAETYTIESKLKRFELEKTPIGNVVDLVTNPINSGVNNVKSWIKGDKKPLDPKKLTLVGIVLLVLIALLYFIFIPLTGITLGSISLYNNTKKATQSITDFDFESASKYLERAQLNASRNENYIGKLEWIFNATGTKPIYDNTTQLLFASDYALSGSATLTKALVPLAKYAKEFEPSIDLASTTPNSTREYRIYLKELESNLQGVDKATYNIGIASQLLSTVNVSVFPKFMQSKLTELKIGNETIINQVLPAQKILQFIPDLLGVDTRQTYLILLQNPGELRSTGGWLTSYAIVSVDGGQIRELKVDDIYNAEGQLRIKGKSFDAPKDMQKALQVTKLSLSLSNWNPDFKNTSEIATYLLSQLEPGTEFNAVIGIDTEVIKKLLDKWGSLNIPGEITPITSKNLDEKIFQLHRDFKPGQSLKSTFLANLANESLKKIFSLDFNGYKDIAQVLSSSLNEKHILINLENKEAAKFIEDSKWSGRILPEYLWSPIPVEWNWGANKANLYLEKNHTLIVNVKDENTVDYEYTLFIQNKSNSDIYPQGEYKDFFRVYLPRNAAVTSVKGYAGNDYSSTVDSGMKVISGWYNVPAKSTRSFQIKYSLTRKVDDLRFPIEKGEIENTLDLLIYKQPGTKSDIYDISVVFPETWAAKKHDGLNMSVNTLNARFTLDTDKPFNISWIKK